MDELEMKAEEKAREWASLLMKAKGNTKKVAFTESSLAHLMKKCFTYQL